MVIVHEWWHYFHVYRTVASGIPSIDKRCKWIFFAKRIRILPIVFMPMTYRIVWFQFCLLFYGAKGLERMSKKKKRVEKMKWNLTRLMLQCWNQSPNKWNLFWLLEQWTLSGGCHRGSSNDRGLCGINKHPKFVISFFLASILSSACSAAFPLHLTDFFFVCVETHVTWTMSKNTTQIDVIKSRS